MPRLLGARRAPAHCARRSRRGTRAALDPLAAGLPPCTRTARRDLDTEIFALGHPDARHLLRHAAHGARSRRRGRAHGRVRVRQGRARGRRVGALPRPAARADRLDEPPRLGHRAADGSARSPPARRRPRSPPSRIASAGSTASSSIPRSCTRRTGRRSSRTSSTRSPARRRRGRPPRSSRSRSRGSAPPSARERVLCALSGGVDSAVAALLVHKAVGDQLTCVFVDHGLLRENEAEQVVETFDGHFHVPLVHVQAQKRFLTRLAGVADPRRSARSSARSSSASSRRRRAASVTCASSSRGRSTPT